MPLCIFTEGPPSLQPPQVLYLEHSVEDLALGRPWKMGTLLHGHSSWRILRDEETVQYGGAGRRKLHGCVITMFDRQSEAPTGVTWSNDSRNNEVGLEQKLLSWSQVREPVSSSSAHIFFYATRPDIG